MPESPERVLTADEQRFIRYWMRAGQKKAEIPRCESLARIKRGMGEKILERKHVKAEIRRRMDLEAFEQQRLDARARERKIEAEDKAKELERENQHLEKDKEMLRTEVTAMKSLPRLKITDEMIEHELARCVELDPALHGKIKLDAIMVASVIKGLARRGNFERLTPAAPPGTGDGGGVYSALFNRMRTGESEGSAALPGLIEAGEPEPADLLPPPPPEPVQPPHVAVESRLEASPADDAPVSAPRTSGGKGGSATVRKIIAVTVS